MGILKKIKKEVTDTLNVDEKISKKQFSKETKEDIHYLKGDIKDLGKQLRTKESVVIKNDALAILHSGTKNQKSFFSEFEKLTREGYMLTGVSETKGLPLSVFGFNIKTGKLFFLSTYQMVFLI